ncbi:MULTISPECIES: 7-cyano-7-deazaguanine synthase QueC [Commensalibacter]|uniref:7-cyano-7-deazaguanine synthase n=1 Tax=Commensalibacter melissae TaxID=2070537 RepID=A0A318NBX7_9PROT|nr:MULTISPECIES: 7-cyano-7-deazaguanine synthase QueC [Commensalibacter]MBH9973644.1 7-cyano-7-deazaguanine synthase QueC [Commensalibacter melissae]MBI0017209.1 7-cyano-7-deazaguanine synthase QueC [Commensalibacter sp. B14384M2]MBI0019069.1 7-cyano-7-deazaguanine synthase QueC [Commensalibacter sp. W8133]MBI0049495.1 7-cyano-7-deazaguanine synthase QueC [Commensalibacter sp. B14384M3]MBI0179553.1 7-cyano-7-deazaguanine synthase QueC [Commensalibacter sp. W8163]
MKKTADFSEGALVLFSGGQDSTTCLAWALTHFSIVETLGFDYGQRHFVEMECRSVIREKILNIQPEWKERLGEDHILKLSDLGAISDTSLTRETEIEWNRQGLPSTFVPGRNLLFLTYAAIIANRRNLRHLVGGMCETDFSGYPDCRDDTLKALQVALNLGMNTRFVLHTPLMWLDKAAEWKLAAILGNDSLIELINKETHSCYLGDRTHYHEWGYGCGHCPACELRQAGWETYLRQKEMFGV